MKICIKKPVGLSVIRDVGSAQALNPVFQSLVPGSTRLDIYSFGPASLFLKEQGVQHNQTAELVEPEILKCKIEQLFYKETYDFVLLGSSPSIKGGVTPEQLTTLYANRFSIPSVMLLDYWGLYRERFCNKNGDLVYEFLPTFLGVLDQRCKSDLVSLGIPSEKMFISHNPWLDRVVNETSIIQCERRLVYDNLAPIRLAFISQPLRMLRSFQNPCPQRVMFEKFMSDLPNDRAFEIQVILHPAENVDHWASLAAQAPNVKISGVAQYNRRKSFFAADATISFNSTLVFEALHLSIPNITLGYEKCFRNSYLNELGLTRVVTNKKEIIDYFRRFNPKKTKEILRAKAMKLRSQELFFSDGSATNRVVDVVTSVCNSQ